MTAPKYYGLYRAIVVDNDDTSTDLPNRCRVKVLVPEIHGDNKDESTLPWAWMCHSIFGGGYYERTKNDGSKETIASGIVALPIIGSTGWVMFEQGELQAPVWMGQWNGQKSETPAVAVSAEGGTYPNIMVIKPPWRENVYIRVVGDRYLEIQYEDMVIRTVGSTNDAEDNGKIQIQSIKSNIEIFSKEGKISMIGKEVYINSENDMTIQAGRWKRLGDGLSVVDTIGDMNVYSTQNTVIFTEITGQQMAGSKEHPNGSWFCMAARTSGYEKHGYFPSVDPVTTGV